MALLTRLRTYCFRSWLVIQLLFLAHETRASTLYGITESSGTSFALVKIDTTTGQAVAVTNFALPQGFNPANLTFHAPSGKFLIRGDQLVNVAPTLGILDPVLSTMSLVPITGLPSGEEKVNGIEYQTSQSRIVISFGTFPGNEERVAEINLAGNVLKLSANLGLGDRDFLVENPVTGDLLAIDTNDFAPRFAIVADVFGTPVITPFSNPPVDANYGELAIAPNSGRIFLPRTTPGELVELLAASDSYETIGSFGLSSRVVGLAFGPDSFSSPNAVPEPSTFVLAALCLAGLGPVAWRKRCARG